MADQGANRVVEVVRTVGRHVNDGLQKLGFATRFFMMILAYSGQSFRRFHLTVREIAGRLGGYGGLGLEWRTRNVTIFSAAEYLALSDNANIVSGRAGLRVAF